MLVATDYQWKFDTDSVPMLMIYNKRRWTKTAITSTDEGRTPWVNYTAWRDVVLMPHIPVQHMVPLLCRCR